MTIRSPETLETTGTSSDPFRIAPLTTATQTSDTGQTSDAGPASAGERPAGGRGPTWLRELLRRPTGVFGLFTLTWIVAAAITARFWTPHDPARADPYQRWQAPSFEHLLGTDQIGRDVFSRLLAGADTALTVALGSLGVAFLVGILLGTLTSLTATWLREAIAVVVDVLIAFPTLLIAMLLATSFGGSLAIVIVSVGTASGIGISRIIKQEITRVASSDYLLAARAAGVGPLRGIVDHIIPNVGALFIVLLSTTAAFSILAEAGLSYLGYGAPADTVSWGRMLTDAQPRINEYPEAVLGPGITITLAVLGLTLLGDALREATDPRLKRGRLEHRRRQHA